MGAGSFVAMPSQYGAVGGYGGYGYSTPSYGGSTPTYGAYPSYGTQYGGMSAGNPLLDHMPMGYLGVGDTTPAKTTGTTTRGVKPKKTRSVTLKKKTGGCC